MQFNEERDFSAYTIRSYEPGKVNIIAPAYENEAESPKERQKALTNSFIMTPRTLIKDWPPASLQEITAHHLQDVGELKPEIVLLGTGENLEFPGPEVTEGLAKAGIGVEVMDSGAACRTYNILVNEGRYVAIATIV
jgi:uncharacterized protein